MNLRTSLPYTGISAYCYSAHFTPPDIALKVLLFVCDKGSSKSGAIKLPMDNLDEPGNGQRRIVFHGKLRVYCEETKEDEKTGSGSNCCGLTWNLVDKRFCFTLYTQML